MNPTPIAYHQSTGYARYAMEPHYMDWQHQPDPYKSYPGRDGVSLPEIQDIFDQDFFDGDIQDVYDDCRLKKTADAPDLKTLLKICMLAGGLTARLRQGGRSFYYRSAPSAGALYPNEIYFAAFDCKMLPAGIYHYGVHNRFLTRLRSGNFANKMASVVFGLQKDLAGVFIISGIFFRSAWKYRKRAYRYLLLDGGHLAENLRLAITAAGFQYSLHYAFDDRNLDELLGLDESREGSLCCIHITGGKSQGAFPKARISELPKSVRDAGRVSPAEVVYPEITDIHEASKIVKESHSAAGKMISSLGISPSKWDSVVPKAKMDTVEFNYSATVFKRRSKRNFIPAPIGKNQLSYMLNLLCRASGYMIDENPDVALSACIGFLAGNIKGIDPGFYLLDPVAQKTGRVFSGNMIEKMAAVCLDQAWLKNAAVHFVFMSNLTLLEKEWGARSYRYAMMTAGRLGHSVYLGATAQGLGCCGIGAFYDNEAKQQLKLNEVSAMLYLVAVGNTK